MSEPSTFRLLYNHFLGQFFENELLAPPGELRSGIVGILAFLAVPGFIYSVWTLEKFSYTYAIYARMPFVDRNVNTWSDKIILLSLALVIPAFATLIKWDSLFPTREDHAILVPFPIRIREILLAKIAALGAFILLFAVSINAAPSVIFPPIVLGESGTFLFLLRYMASNAVATLAASLFACLFLVAVQGVCLALLGVGGFRRLAATLQFALFTIVIALLILSPTLGTFSVRLHTSEAAMWLPPLWFLGLYEVLLGTADAEFVNLAKIATGALLISLVTALLTYTLTYVRRFKRIPEILDRGSTLAVPLWSRCQRIIDRLESRPSRSALLMFVLQTFLRSRVHRLMFGVFLATAGAILIDNVLTVYLTSQGPSATILSAPLIVCFFLITGLRFLYEVPAELPANWIFRLSWHGKTATFHRLALIPVAMVIAPLNIILLGWDLGVVHTLYCLLLSVLLSESIYLGFRKIPFTCTFGAAKWNVTYSLLMWFLIFLVFSSLSVRLETPVLRDPSRFPTTAGILLAIIAWVLYRNHKSWREEPGLRFQDGQAPAVQTLDLSR